MTRQIIVVDVESTGLRADDAILEVAAVNITTGEERAFVPYVPMSKFADASADALRINRYFERGVRNLMLSHEATTLAYFTLRQWLDGNVLAGSNPGFDAKLLEQVDYQDPSRYRGWGDPPHRDRFGEPWHHRKLDLSAYAAGVLGLPFDELPGLHTVCELLGVENDEPHSALADAQATAECFRRLAAKRAES